MREVVSSGAVRRRDDGREYPSEVMIMDQSDLPSALALQKLVYNRLADRSSYFPLNEMEMANLLGEKGLTVGIYVQGKLEAFSSIYYPGMAKDNLGRDLGLPDLELEKAAQLESVIVNPLFRGNSLQRVTADLLLERTFSGNRFRYLLAMIAPENYTSINNTFSMGLRIVRLVKKNANIWRYIFYRDMHAPLRDSYREIIGVDKGDMEKQCVLLQDGFCGICLKNNPTGVQVIFSR